MKLLLIVGTLLFELHNMAVGHGWQTLYRVSALSNYTEQYGYINAEGDVVIKPQFAGAAKLFRYGFAPVNASPQQKQDTGVIDEQGNYVVKPHYTFVSSFCLAKTAFALVKPFGDPNQQFVILRISNNSIHASKRYDGFATNISDNGFIQFITPSNNKIGVMNSRGRTVVPPTDYRTGLPPES